MIRLSPTLVISELVGPVIAANTAHAALTAAFHELIYSTPITVDLKVGGANALALQGAGGENFIPMFAIVLCQTANALNADAQLSFGTSAGGQEIMGAFALAGLATVGQSFVVAMTGLSVTMADDATLDCTVENADSGTSGTIDVVLVGRRL